MKQKFFGRRVAGGLVGAAIALLCGASQAAPTYVFDSSTASSIPGLTGFSTSGAMMSGMTVRVDFVGGGSESRLWGTTGAFTGGAFGTGWSLTESGDTFGGTWVFTNSASLVVEKLTLSGNSGLTVFDVDTYDGCQYTGGVEDFCSGDSARGWRMNFVSGDLSPVVTYSDIVGFGAAAPMGDLFHNVTVNFGTTGIASGFSFIQDTDNDRRFSDVPEPGSLALLGLALAGLAGLRRKQV